MSNNNTKNDDQVNKSFEEEHIFDKNIDMEKDKENKKENKNNANSDLEEGDDIIDVNYDDI